MSHFYSKIAKNTLLQQLTYLRPLSEMHQKQRPRRSTLAVPQPENNPSLQSRSSNEVNTNDVSFSIPDWKQQEIKSMNQQYEKEIYSAVPLSLTDFDTKEEVEFLSLPQKSSDQRYAYERKLVHREDFSILAFILCLEQILIGDSNGQVQRLQKFKKKVNELDLCSVKGIPAKMQTYYDNKIIKKILFQYINKGSYNVSLLQVLLRRNSVLKFSLSLVSKAILRKRNLIQLYTDQVPVFAEMRNCGDQFGVLATIKVKEGFIETQNFYVAVKNQNIQVFRKQNIIKLVGETLQGQKIQQKKRPLTPDSKLCTRQISRKSTKETASSKQQQSQKKSLKRSSSKGVKRSSSLASFFRKFICF